MKNFLVIAVMLLFGLAALAEDGKDKKQDKKDHSPTTQSSDKHHDDERDEHGRKHMKFTQEGEFASISTSPVLGAGITLTFWRASGSISPAATFINFIFFQF